MGKILISTVFLYKIANKFFYAELIELIELIELVELVELVELIELIELIELVELIELIELVESAFCKACFSTRFCTIPDPTIYDQLIYQWMCSALVT